VPAWATGGGRPPIRGSCYTDVTAFRRRFPHHTFMKTVYGGLDMKTSRLVALVLAALLAATTTLPAHETRPVVSVETSEDALECAGDGLIHVVADECMHDGGKSAVGDSLEVYCHLGTARFCLSGEECPWREAPASGGDETCSRVGLDAEWMATAWCEEWSGVGYFTCTELGQINLQKRSEADRRRDRGEPD
jgi:hypothetical protein